MTAYRFNNHHRPGTQPGVPGPWCRASHLPVSERLAQSDDRRCLHDCPDSDIEEYTPEPEPVDTTEPDTAAGIASQFSAAEVECLIRTAGNLYDGADPDDLSQWQHELAGKAAAILRAEDDAEVAALLGNDDEDADTD